MNIEFIDDGRAKLQMKSYLEKVIDLCGKRIKKSKSPARKNIFTENKTLELLPKNEADIFYSVACLLLYVAIRARRDIQQAISYLSIRVLLLAKDYD